MTPAPAGLSPLSCGLWCVFLQGINAQQLAAASFGSVMLQTVGRVYQTEADIYQGNPLLGGLGKLRRAGNSIR